MPAPVEPTSLFAWAIGENTASLTWQNGETYDSIHIEAKQGAGGTYVEIDVVGGEDTSGDVTLSPDGALFYFKIRGYTALNGYSAYSEESSCRLPLWRPTGLSGRADSDSEVTLNWSCVSIGLDGFNIYKDGAYLASVGPSTKTYQASGLTAETFYEFYVTAYNAAVESPVSNTIRIFTADPPASCTGLSAVAVSDTEIRLAWTNPADNETGSYVYRSTDAITYSKIATLGANSTSCSATLLTSNTLYYFYVTNYNLSGESNNSNVASASTFAAISQPTNLVATPISDTKIDIYFDDNSSEEDNHILERRAYASGAQKVTDGGFDNWASATNLTSWTEALGGTSTINREATTKRSGAYAVRGDVDAGDNDAYISQAVTLVAGAAYRLRVSYKTAAGKTLFVQLTDSTGTVNLAAAGTWTAGADHITLPASETFTEFVIDFSAHASYTAYTLYVGHYSAWSAQESSSFYLDDVSVENGWTTAATLEPNRFCYRNTGLTKNTAYDYQVRAKQGSVYSFPSTTATATTFNDPTAPSDLAAAAESDVTIRLTWTEPADTTVAGYKIEKSTDGGSTYAQIAQVSAGISEYLARGLSASTQYHFKIRSYSIVGNSAYTSADDATTLSAYSESKFESLMRKNPDSVVLLAELNPKMEVLGWALTSGKTYTYEAAFDEERANVAQVYQNGTALTVKTSITAVEAAAGSFYYDYWNRLLYVHPIDSDSASDYIIEAGFWIYITNWKSSSVTGSFTVDSVARDYLPLFSGAIVPEISQAMARYYQSGASYSSGQISFFNGLFGASYFWDTLFSRYTWEMRPIVLKAGGTDFSYTDFETIYTGLIEDRSIDDRLITFILSDPRKIISATLPPNKYSSADFVNLPTALAGKPIPICYGDVSGIVSDCVDLTNKVFKLADHRIKAVVSCTLNGATITENTDFFVDYQRGLMVLHRDDVAYSSSDKIVVNLQGRVNVADELITEGAEVFLDICRSYMGLEVAELDTDSIYWTKAEMDFDVAFFLYSEQNDGASTVLRTIEHSVQAVTFIANDGRIGLQPLTDDDPPGVKYIKEEMISDFSRMHLMESVFDWIRIHYDEEPQTQTFLIESYFYEAMRIKKRLTKQPLDILTYLTTQADAQTLLAAVTDWIDVDYVTFNANGLLMNSYPGQIFRLQRTRDFNSSGSSNDVKMRIISITKNFSTKRVKIVAEEA